MTEETEINPMRVTMVTSIIQQNQGEAFTVENLTRFFPADFDLGEDDLAYYRETHPIEFEAEAEPTPAATQAPAPEPQPPQARALAASRAPESKPLEGIAPEPAPPADPAAIDAAVTRRNKAEQDLANARVLQITEDNQERALRGDLAKAVSAFQSGFPPITREQLMRDVIASEQERKAAGHPSRPQSRPGKSVVDRVAFYGRGGNPARGDYRRGAFASQAKGAPNYDPRRGAVAKVPSER
jgi:hypothetical protein